MSTDKNLVNELKFLRDEVANLTRELREHGRVVDSLKDQFNEKEQDRFLNGIEDSVKMGVQAALGSITFG